MWNYQENVFSVYPHQGIQLQLAQHSTMGQAAAHWTISWWQMKKGVMYETLQCNQPHMLRWHVHNTDGECITNCLEEDSPVVVLISCWWLCFWLKSGICHDSGSKSMASITVQSMWCVEWQWDRFFSGFPVSIIPSVLHAYSLSYQLAPYKCQITHFTHIICLLFNNLLCVTFLCPAVSHIWAKFHLYTLDEAFCMWRKIASGILEWKLKWEKLPQYKKNDWRGTHSVLQDDGMVFVMITIHTNYTHCSASIPFFSYSSVKNV